MAKIFDIQQRKNSDSILLSAVYTMHGIDEEDAALEAMLIGD